ncbi:MAG: pentapeptide repeat-containing protein [Chloroflexaceae bacterium]|nr:pentapeptide repeat-containing protein [Chloroflexaceae bacterium]
MSSKCAIAPRFLPDCGKPMTLLSAAEVIALVQQGKSLHRSELSRIQLQGANLVRGDFTAAYLRGANFTEAVCTGANFNEASLMFALLCRGRLSPSHVYQSLPQQCPPGRSQLYRRSCQPRPTT